MLTVINKEVDRLVEERLSAILADPQKVIEIYDQAYRRQKVQLAEQQPMVDAYRALMDATGLASCAKVADFVGLTYIDPQGKPQRMGNIHFISVLHHDGIIFKDPGGYRLSARYKDYGTTRVTEKNGMMKSSVLFTSRGIDYLKKRYTNDSRVWRSRNGKLYYTMGLPEIGREGQNPHL